MSKFKESKRFALKEVANLTGFLHQRLSAIDRNYPDSGNKAEELLKECRTDIFALEKKLAQTIEWMKSYDEQEVIDVKITNEEKNEKMFYPPNS